MTPLWPPLALAAITCGMLALPLTPMLLETWRRKDAAPLPVRNDDGDIRNFALSFRQRIEPLRPALTACAVNNSVTEVKLKNGERVLLIGTDRTRDLHQQRFGKAVLFAQQSWLCDQLVFEKDVYAAAGLCGGRNNIFRAVLGEGDITLAEATQVLRWIHAEGELAAGRNCDLWNRCSSQKAIYAGPGCRFQRMHAPMIMTLNNAPLISSSPNSIPSSPHATSGPNLGRSRIQGSLYLGPTEILLGNIVTTGDICIEEGGRVYGSAKANGDIELRSKTRIDGSLISTGAMRIGAQCLIKGPVLAEREITIASGTRIGAPDFPTTVSAPHIRIASDCIVHGTIWARVEGNVERQ